MNLIKTYSYQLQYLKKKLKPHFLLLLLLSLGIILIIFANIRGQILGILFMIIMVKYIINSKIYYRLYLIISNLKYKQIRQLDLPKQQSLFQDANTDEKMQEAKSIKQKLNKLNQSNDINLEDFALKFQQGKLQVKQSQASQRTQYSRISKAYSKSYVDSPLFNMKRRYNRSSNQETIKQDQRQIYIRISKNILAQILTNLTNQQKNLQLLKNKMQQCFYINFKNIQKPKQSSYLRRQFGQSQQTLDEAINILLQSYCQQTSQKFIIAPWKIRLSRSYRNLHQLAQLLKQRTSLDRYLTLNKVFDQYSLRKRQESIKLLKNISSLIEQDKLFKQKQYKIGQNQQKQYSVHIILLNFFIELIRNKLTKGQNQILVPRYSYGQGNCIIFKPFRTKSCQHYNIIWKKDNQQQKIQCLTGYYNFWNVIYQYISIIKEKFSIELEKHYEIKKFIKKII